MLNVPPQVLDTYKHLLNQEDIPKHEHGFYTKWLRFYWDFCHKYHHQTKDSASLPLFMNKLRSKNQSVLLCNQAANAVSLYLQFDTTAPSFISRETTAHTGNSLEQLRPTCSVAEKDTIYQQRGASWEPIFDGLKAEIMLRKYSPRTLKTYRSWVRKFQAFVKSKDGEQITQRDAKDFLTDLAVTKQVAASTQNQAFNALLFLFRHVLKAPFDDMKDTPRAKRKTYIPVVLSRTEVDAVFQHLSLPHLLPVQLLYGCGLRISECITLRLQDFNFDMGILTVRNGKGKKNRTMPLPQSLMPALLKQVARIKDLHNEDLSVGYAGVFLPDDLGSKYKNAATDLAWQWIFPARGLTLVSKTGEYKRYHLHDTVLQKAIRTAVKRAQLIKRATAHTFRHSYASHLLQNHYDIRTIQVLMGHSDVKTTMIYLQTIPDITLKDAKSPLDF